LIQELYAFWKYDTYPFCLGGEVSEITEKGNVIPVGYQGHIFKPIKLVPKEQGLKIKQQLDELKDQYQKAQDELSKSFKEKANEILPEIFK